MRKRVQNKKLSRRHSPRKSGDVPVTQDMLYLVRDELVSRISSSEHETKSLRKEMNSKFLKMDEKFEAMDARFTTIDGKFEAIDARFTTIDGKFEAMDARFTTIDGKFEAMDAKFTGIKGEFEKVYSRFEGIDSKLDKILGEVHRIALVVEEQNARNKFVLDGHTFLSDRLERVEKKVFGENP